MARLGRLIQLDRTLLFALASRVWQSASGPITVALILRHLSPGQQGIWYTLWTIVGVQAFFELGLLNVLVSQAGHARAAEDGESSNSRLRQLTHSALIWFAGAAILYAVTALSYGLVHLPHERCPRRLARPVGVADPAGGDDRFSVADPGDLGGCGPASIRLSTATDPSHHG